MDKKKGAVVKKSEDTAMDLRWIKRPVDLMQEESELLAVYGLSTLYEVCVEVDNDIAVQGIKHYDQKTHTTVVNGVSLSLDEDALQTRRAKKPGINCNNLPVSSVHKFIADAIALKGNNAYISESLFGMFHGKSHYKHKINVAREVTNQAKGQMAAVVSKK